ncbi:MAG: hypothetical protein IT479_04510 [Xanthomonadales bacterium]|nr:hypothetical protein [Xanthomonadales bacterium]MCC6592516.1 hypothetical protein [Xanthomonadales bacterium]MCE7931504.1 hypothetical protein [Xanthomonadales bacterium PRO6]
MILGVFSLLQRRSAVAIAPTEIETLDRDGARALNWARSRGMRRARRRLLWHAGVLGLCLLGVGSMYWTPVGMLVFVLLNALIGMLLDCARVLLTLRGLEHSHGREYRAEQLLNVALAHDAGALQRPQARSRPAVLASFGLAFAVVAISWLVLLYLDRLGWQAAFGTPLLPLLLFLASTFRIGIAVQEIRLARMLTTGTREIYLEVDDTIGVHLLALTAALLSWPLGDAALAVLAWLVAATPLAWWAARWWWLRKSSAALSRRVRRTHPALAQSDATADEARDEF